jgi:hypothetical protein
MSKYEGHHVGAGQFDFESEEAAELARLKTELAKALERIRELEEKDLENLFELARQGHCDDPPNGVYDSCALSHIADAMYELAEKGRFEIIESHGRRVIGKFKPAPGEAQAEEEKR